MDFFSLLKRKLGQVNTQVQCPKCKQVVKSSEAAKSMYICSNCKRYMPIGALDRLEMIMDAGSFEPWFEDVEGNNPLKDEAYVTKLEAAREKNGISEAVVVGRGKIGGEETVIGVCDAKFLMGSMGYAMGERITRAFEKAIELKLPVILFCCSGGARMQEGIISLMQMEKTAAAVKRHSDAGLFYCSVLTDPTMGGVTASYAMLGDVILAEPKARVGFAGPRVIQQTIGQVLPKGFQKAEFLLKHGMIDGIVERKELKKTLNYLLSIHGNGVKVKKSLKDVLPGKKDVVEEVEVKETKTPWEKVKICRSWGRLSTMDYVERIFDDFYELHGDRYYSDDRALIGGVAYLDGQPVTVLAELRGNTMEECMERNYGMPMPDGYRKAVRLMKQAEKFKRPIISFISTPGAFCGIDAEERGQGEAIARSIMEMSGLKVPVLCILTGECGSGGALATAVGNQVWMTENATYAILSPEGYSSIVWKTEGKAEDAAKAMKITAHDLYKMNIIDKIIPEFGEAKQETASQISAYMKANIKEFLKKYSKMNGNEIVEERYQRFRKF
ncbi:MAG: acetyl-CoA carboxylase carboxyl transferase subunit alpha [Lachnospiraceae bacterium]|nr:acetyl-CoA carboxylase carboxyl transferase subunit alpha [Lachnospiraceae bacterium]